MLSSSNIFSTTRLIKSWKGLWTANATMINARPTALDVTKEVSAKYNIITPNSRPERPIEQPIDVIKAEKEFKITFLMGYSILIKDGNYYMILAAQFQGHPHKIYCVSCPQKICVHSLSKDNRIHLSKRLESIKELIPEPVWQKLEKRYNIIKKDWLVISGESEA